MTKLCTICYRIKTLEEFSKDKRQRFGRRPECKDCENLRPSLHLKRMRNRVKRDINYKGIEVNIKIDELMAIIHSKCFFCQRPAMKFHLHRIDINKGYINNNVVKAHKGCHETYHNTLRKRDNLGRFVRKVGY